MQTFVLISILRGQPKTPPSVDDLGVLHYHLNTSKRDSKQRRTCALQLIRCATDQDSHPKNSLEQCIPWDCNHKNHTFVSAGFCAAAQHSKSIPWMKKRMDM